MSFQSLFVSPKSAFTPVVSDDVISSPVSGIFNSRMPPIDCLKSFVSQFGYPSSSQLSTKVPDVQVAFQPDLDEQVAQCVDVIDVDYQASTSPTDNRLKRHRERYHPNSPVDRHRRYLKNKNRISITGSSGKNALVLDSKVSFSNLPTSGSVGKPSVEPSFYMPMAKPILPQNQSSFSFTSTFRYSPTLQQQSVSPPPVLSAHPNFKSSSPQPFVYRKLPQLNLSPIQSSTHVTGHPPAKKAKRDNNGIVPSSQLPCTSSPCADRTNLSRRKKQDPALKLSSSDKVAVSNQNFNRLSARITAKSKRNVAFNQSNRDKSYSRRIQDENVSATLQTNRLRKPIAGDIYRTACGCFMPVSSLPHKKRIAADFPQPCRAILDRFRPSTFLPTKRAIRKKKVTLQDKYIFQKKLGAGGNGIVYAAIRKADNVEVAIKKIEKNERGRWGTIKGKKVPLEIELLYRAGRSGTNSIIKMHEWYEHSHSYSLVMERPQPAVDLFDYLDTFGRMSEGVARHIFRQLVSAVKLFHANGVIHRDIKDENVILNLHTGVAKIIDFGCGTFNQKDPITSFAGTYEFYPPEWYLHKRYNGVQLDTWSLGVLLYTLVNGQLPFANRNEIATRELKYPSDRYPSLLCRNLINSILRKDPCARIDLDGIQNHPWMRGDAPPPYIKPLLHETVMVCDERQSSKNRSASLLNKRNREKDLKKLSPDADLGSTSALDLSGSSTQSSKFCSSSSNSLSVHSPPNSPSKSLKKTETSPKNAIVIEQKKVLTCEHSSSRLLSSYVEVEVAVCSSPESPTSSAPTKNINFKTSNELDVNQKTVSRNLFEVLAL